MAQFVNMFEVDLQKPNHPQPLRAIVGEGDSNGMKVGAYVTDGGTAVSLGGSCVGKVVRADGATVQLTGTISGNSAYVVLDQQSCAIEGQIQVAVCWVNSSNVTTLVLAYGTVVNTQTGTAIQPSTPIPDLTQLLAEISAMETATAAANAAASSALTNFAGAFSSSTAYTAGQYVTYTDGKFYRFTTNHAAGAWNSAHVVAVTAGGELTDLKSAIDEVYMTTAFTKPYVGGQVFPYAMESGRTYNIVNLSSGQNVNVQTCTSDGTTITVIKNGIVYNETVTYTPDESTSYIRVYSGGNDATINIWSYGTALAEIDARIDALNGAEYQLGELDWASSGTRLNASAIVNYADVTVSFPNSSYYYFLYSYNPDGTEKETSVSWQTNNTFALKDVYRLTITVKKGSAGTDTFTSEDIANVNSDLAVNVQCINVPQKISELESMVSVPVYVATTGSDATGDGTSSYPYATITKALAKSDFVVVKSGTYTESITISNRNSVSIIADPNKTNSTDTVKIATSAYHALSITNVLDVNLEGIIFNGASNDVVFIDKCANLKIQNCEFNNSANKDGLEIQRSTGKIVSCKGSSNYNDGFNINYYGDTVFINCEGFNNVNGDGISHHTGCTGAVIGGYWHGNGKAGISTPTYGAIVNISNAFCYSNVYGMQVYGGDDVTENTIHIKLDNVVFKDNTYGLQVDKYIVDCVNCVFTGNTTDKTIVSGTINEY